MPNRVRVFALAREEGEYRLRLSVGHTVALTTDQGATEIVAALKTRRCDVVVIDPSALRVDLLWHVSEAAEAAGAGVLVYAPPADETALLTLRLVQRVHTEIVYIGAENEAQLVRKRLEAFARPCASALVLRELAKAVQQLPSPLCCAIVSLFAWMPIPTTTASLLALEGKSVRTWERCLKSAGLERAERFLIAARLARAWQRLTDGESEAAIIDAYGYASIDAIGKKLRHMIGQARLEALATPLELFASRLAAGLRRSDMSHKSRGE